MNEWDALTLWSEYLTTSFRMNEWKHFVKISSTSHDKAAKQTTVLMRMRPGDGLEELHEWSEHTKNVLKEFSPAFGNRKFLIDKIRGYYDLPYSVGVDFTYNVSSVPCNKDTADFENHVRRCHDGTVERRSKVNGLIESVETVTPLPPEQVSYWISNKKASRLIAYTYAIQMSFSPEKMDRGETSDATAFKYSDEDALSYFQRLKEERALLDTHIANLKKLLAYIKTKLPQQANIPPLSELAGQALVDNIMTSPTAFLQKVMDTHAQTKAKEAALKREAAFKREAAALKRVASKEARSNEKKRKRHT